MTITYDVPSMPAAAKYRLVFLVEGEETTLAVTVPRTGDVDLLRELMYTKGRFDGFSLADVRLFQLGLVLRSVTIPTTTSHVVYYLTNLFVFQVHIDTQTLRISPSDIRVNDYTFR